MLNDLSVRAIDEDKLSDCSGYDILAGDASKPFEDEYLIGGAFSEPEVLPSLQHQRYRRRRRARRRWGADRSQRTVIVVKQPKIDLDKIMVVAFGKIHAILTVKESVAFYMPPQEDESKDVGKKTTNGGKIGNILKP
ncbi:unnamed protein product [Rodentolepis nana]|uniref:TAFII55_N domain-containing protein n=1 Tax=Rodentolepis nana TaxID=102285 RepID=A0A0R3T2W9_RODNA|nr:unnamed protein product [Rodentolepis nana]